eukprot:3941230-Rhodomonas_salina.3
MGALRLWVGPSPAPPTLQNNWHVPSIDPVSGNLRSRGHEEVRCSRDSVLILRPMVPYKWES